MTIETSGFTIEALHKRFGDFDLRYSQAPHVYQAFGKLYTVAIGGSTHEVSKVKHNINKEEGKEDTRKVFKRLFKGEVSAVVYSHYTNNPATAGTPLLTVSYNLTTHYLQIDHMYSPNVYMRIGKGATVDLRNKKIYGEKALVRALFALVVDEELLFATYDTSYKLSSLYKEFYSETHYKELVAQYGLNILISKEVEPDLYSEVLVATRYALKYLEGVFPRFFKKHMAQYMRLSITVRSNFKALAFFSPTHGDIIVKVHLDKHGRSLEKPFTEFQRLAVVIVHELYHYIENAVLGGVAISNILENNSGAHLAYNIQVLRSFQYDVYTSFEGRNIKKQVIKYYTSPVEMLARCAEYYFIQDFLSKVHPENPVEYMSLEKVKQNKKTLYYPINAEYTEQLRQAFYNLESAVVAQKVYTTARIVQREGELLSRVAEPKVGTRG